MGFNAGTIAIGGKPIQEVHGDLGLRETEVGEEDPESPVVGAMLPSGWYQVYFNDLGPIDIQGCTRGGSGVEMPNGKALRADRGAV